MHDEAAFRILGLEPTVDERAVRSAYVRLARIYHPDRYIDEPDEVRREAQRLMQHVTNAYAYICSRQRELRAAPVPQAGKKDPWELARRYREARAQRASEALEQQARHARWVELEREAAERAQREAELASVLGDSRPLIRPMPSGPPRLLERGRSRFEVRLEEARAHQPPKEPSQQD